MIAPAFTAALLCTGALTVKTTPVRALAASGDPVLLDVVSAPPAEGRLTATTNVGTLSAPRAAGPGRFRLAFTPPRERFPQVALIRLELDRGGGGARESTWLALPVDGSETLTLETTKARAKVDVTIGDRTFGPVQSGAKGEVEIAVVVPPGIGSARARSVDRLGNQKVKAVDLAPPPFAQVRLAIPSGAGASWADAQPLPVEVFAIDAQGAPAAAPPALQVDRGALGTPSPGPAPGVFVVGLRAPEQVPPDRRATVTAAGAEPLVVPLRSGPPARIAVSAQPASYTAGSKQRIALSARLEDARGNAADPGTPVHFAANLGTIEPGDRNASPTLVLPDAFAGREVAQVTASAGSVEGQASIELRAGPPASAKAALPQSMARAGDPFVEGTLQLHDAFGNPVQGAAPALSCTVGRAELVRELGHGRYQLRFGANPSDRTGAGRLLAVARGGPELPVAEVEVLAAPSDFGLSVGVRAGAQSNFALLHGGGGLAEVSVRPVGRWPLEVVVEGGGSALLRVSQRFQEAGSGATLSTDLRWASGAVGVRASLGLGPVVSAYAALTGGAQYTWASYQVSGGTGPNVARGDAGLAPLARVAGGISYRAGPGRLLAELQGTYAPPPSATSLGGNLGQATAMLGYLVEVR